MLNSRSLPILILCLPLLCTPPAAAEPRRTTDPFAESLLEEINLARTRPQAYADYLRQHVDTLREPDQQPPEPRSPGPASGPSAATAEALRFLAMQKPIPSLIWSNGLASAAAELATEQTQSGAIGHDGQKSGGIRERIERQGTWEGGIGESIAYSPRTPRGMVIQLIIDEGVPERGHRATLFDPSYGVVGISCAPHPLSGKVCVIDFAGSFRE